MMIIVQRHCVSSLARKGLLHQDREQCAATCLNCIGACSCRQIQRLQDNDIRCPSFVACLCGAFLVVRFVSCCFVLAASDSVAVRCLAIIVQAHLCTAAANTAAAGRTLTLSSADSVVPLATAGLAAGQLMLYPVSLSTLQPLLVPLRNKMHLHRLSRFHNRMSRFRVESCCWTFCAFWPAQGQLLFFFLLFFNHSFACRSRQIEKWAADIGTTATDQRREMTIERVCSAEATVAVLRSPPETSMIERIRKCCLLCA